MIARLLTRSFAIILLLTLWCFIAAASTTIKSVRLVQPGHSWQLIFNIKGPLQYSSFSLSGPNRVVVDLNNAKLLQPLSNKLFAGTPIKDARTAYHQGNKLRIVFDLKQPLDYIISKTVNNMTGETELIVSFVPTNHEIDQLHKKTRAKETLANFLHPLITLTEPKHRPRKIIVVVDPGHGGKDPGATGPGGTHEKTIVLAISKRLKKIIDEQPGFTAKLTRDADYYITLRDRLHIARRDHADMFVAIHADKWYNAEARGASVFALSTRGATSEAARWLADRENASELMGGVKLNDKTRLLKSVLLNLSQTATIRTSLKIGQDMIDYLRQITAMHSRHVEQAAFVVLKSPDIPSLLVETGFISNPYEERRLRTARYQREIAMSVMKGIRQYFKSHPPRGTWLAYWKTHPHSTGDYRVLG